MSVVLIGPFFHSDPTLFSRYVKEAEGAIADATHRKVNAFQSLFFRYNSSPPTGYASRSVRTRAMSDHHVVTDSGIVYGPWLEGVGSRNQTTRFKGYAIFRRTTASMQREAVSWAQPIIDRMVKELN